MNMTINQNKDAPIDINPQNVNPKTQNQVANNPEAQNQSIKMPESTPQKVQKNPIPLAVNIAGIVIFLLICAAITFFAWPQIKDFVSTPTAFPEYVKDHRVMSVFLYLAMQVLQVVVAVIPGEFLEIGAGLAFGWFGGLLVALLGVALGTAVIFVVFRKLGKPLIMSFLGDKGLDKLEHLNNNKRRDSIIFFVYFIPGLPKDLLTYAAAFFDISLWRFLLLTLIARIPSVLTSTIAGQSIIAKDYKTAIIIFAVTGVVAVLGFVFSEKIMSIIEKKKRD
jgi:uncharacterized membrane protein YdjX (TVP38/TMEM64 family)